MPATGMPDGQPPPNSVFLSYARTDRAQAQPIVALLEAAGFHVWWDGMLEGGDRFLDTTEAALERALAVVVLWSQHSYSSHWVHDEAGRGRDRQRLVPVSLDGSNAPLGFRQFQIIDAKDAQISADDPAMQMLLRTVAALHERKIDLPPPAKTAQPQVGRRQLLIGGAGLGLAVAAVAAWRWQPWAPARPGNSLAIMPFNNLGGNDAQLYFAEGLSDDLRSKLSNDPNIQVVAQTSSASAAQDLKDPREIGARLGVAFVLAGSVRRAAQTIRMVAELVDARTGDSIWSESFDRPMTDILQVQSNLATLVADTLTDQIAGTVQRNANVGGTDDPAAFEAYLKGRQLYDSALSEESDRQSLLQFEQAVARDPGYAAALAASSRALTVIANNYASGDELAALYSRAIQAARRAVMAAPRMAEGYAALGFVLFNGTLDAGSASEPYRKSYALGFGNADILAAYANFATRTTDFDGARDALFRAERLDPLNPNIFRNQGLNEFSAGDLPAARNKLRYALSLSPDISGVHDLLGQINYIEGHLDAALIDFGKEPSMLSRQMGRAIVLHKMGQTGPAQSALQALVADMGDNSLFQQAEAHTQWGDTSRALELLEQAYRAGDSGLVKAQADPLLAPLRAQPRFQALMNRMGMPSVTQQPTA